MFDLNEKKFNGVTIFNNGQGGKVENVDISIEKRKQDEPESYPDYKLIVEDTQGGKINQGFYYPIPKAGVNDEINEKTATREIGRVVHIAKAVMGNNYVFPSVSSPKNAYDVLFKLIAENANKKKYNVFVTYGNVKYVSKYMGLRYFNFIEDATTTKSRLVAQPDDVLDRVEPDKDVPDELSNFNLNSTKEVENEKSLSTEEDWV